MIKEVRILLEEGTHKSKHGSVFENLIRILLEKERYNVTQNVNDAGLEIDLLAEHKTNGNVLYAECKAKVMPKSGEIKNFIYAMDYGVEDKMPDYGYFIHTQELVHQAATLKVKLEAKKDNVTFIGPNEIIEILEDAQKIVPFRKESIDQLEISKLVLAYSPEGFHYILILQKGSVAQFFVVLNAKNHKSSKSEIQEFYQNNIKELTDLSYYEISSSSRSKREINPKVEDERDIILQIRETENWYEFAPASFEHFIGRLNIRRNLKGFLERVRTYKTTKRIFFLDGKSGWGKSSLLAELKGSSLNLRFWKGRFFVSAIDTRSASSANFIGLAFKNMVEDAMRMGFIKKNIFSKELVITSPHNILADPSIQNLFDELEKSKKLLVLIFDQFEDQFRKESLFDAFYKFCLDIDAYKANIVVGFSWKSEINIPIGNPSHPKFIQLRDFAYQITIPPFSQNDVKQIINQLEESIRSSIGIELQNRIIQSSQGFPWLAKKICTHTLSQIEQGKTIDDIIEEELNYKELFESDLLGLSGEEDKALEFIARRAYDGNPFEISEYDKLDLAVVDSLIHKRLIIRTGSTYNVYWDIFRDYIVTKEIPVIGESYILRYSGKACQDCFMSFELGETRTLSELCASYSNDVSESYMYNILLELRGIGLIKKHSAKDEYILTPKVSEVTESFFQEYITKKLSNYRPYFELLKIEKEKIQVDDIVRVLKTIFKTEKLAENTWSVYARYLIIWFKMSKLDIRNKIVDIAKGRGAVVITNKYDQIPGYSPVICLQSYQEYKVNPESLPQRKVRDLILMGLVTEGQPPLIKDDDLQSEMAKEAKKNSYIKEAYEIVKSIKRPKSMDLIEKFGDKLSSQKSLASKKQVASVLLSWAKFLAAFEDDGPIEITAVHKSANLKNYYLSNGPNHVIDSIIDIDTGDDMLNLDKRKVSDLLFLGLAEEKVGAINLTSEGLSILNSSEPEFELANFIERNEHLKSFKDLRDGFMGMKLAQIIQQEAAQKHFEGYSVSSIRTKWSIYTTWIKYQIKYKNFQQEQLF